jgi:hypothetical protein
MVESDEYVLKAEPDLSSDEYVFLYPFFAYLLELSLLAWYWHLSALGTGTYFAWYWCLVLALTGAWYWHLLCLVLALGTGTYFAWYRRLVLALTLLGTGAWYWHLSFLCLLELLFFACLVACLNFYLPVLTCLLI